MDANICLLKDGSAPEDTWGFSLYPNEKGEQALEYISLINMRPAQGNHELELKHPKLRGIIRQLVQQNIPDLKL